MNSSPKISVVFLKNTRKKFFSLQLPEVNHAAEVEEEETGRQFSVFLIQNIGLLVGYGIMLFLAYFGGQIDFGN